jgi:quinolinate synthase
MTTIEEQVNRYGYVTETIADDIDLIAEINRLKKEKNAVILAHYYVNEEIQDLADYIGDSLGLSQQAAATEADMIIFCGVHFMGETAKILSPNKKVVIPDLNAGCSLADSAPADKFAAFKARYPDHIVISYINCSAEIKALTDIVCTSSNALQIVR